MKQIFAAKLFASKLFASGIWTGQTRQAASNYIRRTVSSGFITIRHVAQSESWVRRIQE